MAENASCQSFAPGETVVSQGEPGDSLFLVVSGSLDVFQATDLNLSASLPGHQVASLHRSDIFGEMALCTGEDRSASVICNKECVLIEIERQHLLPLLEEHPEILETMGQSLPRAGKSSRPPGNWLKAAAGFDCPHATPVQPPWSERMSWLRPL